MLNRSVNPPLPPPAHLPLIPFWEKTCLSPQSFSELPLSVEGNSALCFKEYFSKKSQQREMDCEQSKDFKRLARGCLRENKTKQTIDKVKAGYLPMNFMFIILISSLTSPFCSASSMAIFLFPLKPVLSLSCMKHIFFLPDYSQSHLSFSVLFLSFFQCHPAFLYTVDKSISNSCFDSTPNMLSLTVEDHNFCLIKLEIWIWKKPSKRNRSLPPHPQTSTILRMGKILKFMTFSQVRKPRPKVTNPPADWVQTRTQAPWLWAS